MNYLIFPPFADPTQCYTALPVLKSYLKKMNIEVKAVDLNIIGQRDLINKSKYYNEIIDGFCNVDNFYDENIYQSSCDALTNFYDEISKKSKKYLFSNNSNFCKNGPWNIKRLNDYFKEKASPFHSIYKSFIEDISAKCEFIALSCVFVSQLPEVFYLAKLVKEFNSEIDIIVGGPCISQIVDNLNNKDIKSLLEYFDVLCLYEGEACFRDYIQYKRGKKISNSVIKINNNLVYGDYVATDVELLATPDFSDIDFSLYLAPDKFILYSPSRGCYWNKCSFCHYGFNQKVEVKYREVSSDKVIADLKSIKNSYNCENFYFSCDVISPKFVKEFSQKAIENNLEIHWSTDLRGEKNYTKEVCHKMRESGLISVAIGVESGCDKILEIMNKGINIDQMTNVCSNMFNAGIAVCPMMFHYHPKETINDAIDSLNWVEKNSSFISLFIMGEFGLTSGSDIYFNYKKYKISEIFFHPDDQFKIYPYYELEGPHNSLDNREEIDMHLDKIAKKFVLRAYPFAGAISTHHSFLYFKKFGNRIFHINN